MKKYISIDIGGTAIKYGIVSENAEVLLKKEMKTEAQKGGPAILEKVIGIVEELKGEADAGDYEPDGSSDRPEYRRYAPVRCSGINGTGGAADRVRWQRQIRPA